MAGATRRSRPSWTDVFGDEVNALFVKASGADMAIIEPVAMWRSTWDYLLRLRKLPGSGRHVRWWRNSARHLLRADSPTPSIEALVHAFLPGIFIDHTHADAILTLTNRKDGEAVVRRGARR